MKKNLIFLLLSLFSLPLLADSDLHYNLINLSASASMDVSNDQVSSQFQVTLTGSNTTQLAQQVNQKSAEALQIAKAYPEVKIQTGSYTTHPRYTAGQISGWQVSQQFLLRSEDFDQMSSLLGELQRLGNVQSMQFSVSDALLESTRQTLMTQAIEKFQGQAKVIQQQFNQPGYRLVSLSVNQGGYYPAPRMDRAMMLSENMVKAEPVAVEAGTNEVTVEVNGQIQLISDPAMLN